MTVPIVAIARGEDKFKLLEEVANQAGFWGHLDAAWQKSGKPKEHFHIAIKPNLMIFMNRQVPEIATEPALVEHLVRLLQEHGYSHIKVVEAQNTMNNWVRNRSVANVARVAGYTGQGYQIVDLTLEKVRHVYKVRGLPDWKNWVGRTWKEADYRIDFAKFKTQLDNYFTLCLKNEFGTLPLANKYWHYHTRLPYWACALYTLVNFPVHFGFIDAYRASDGTAGFAVQYNPKLLKMILASENLIALDLVGAKLMGIDAWDAPLPRFVMQHLGEPAYTVIGDATPIEEWENVPDDIESLVDVGQALYIFSNITAGGGIINLDTNEFPPRFPLMRWYYQAMNTLFLLINGKLLSRSDHRMVHATIRHEQQCQMMARNQQPEQSVK
jgi:uncharacterized protein (DUF362 family)